MPTFRVVGLPTEQWGVSNNPRPALRAGLAIEIRVAK